MVDLFISSIPIKKTLGIKLLNYGSNSSRKHSNARTNERTPKIKGSMTQNYTKDKTYPSRGSDFST